LLFDLLLVSALVLAAATLWDVVKVVTAFTLAHTITLTLAALNLVHLPEGVVEPLISASIVFVAVQNTFWPTQARGWSRLAVAFFFGLFHGLGFAGGLLDAMREMEGATMTLALLAFSLGVEVGHQMVVLPLFALLKAARHTQADAVMRKRLSMGLQRVGSAVISVAGVYYLCLALNGSS
jgi:HupE / UreJ protein